jgi:hypothetical protein
MRDLLYNSVLTNSASCYKLIVKYLKDDNEIPFELLDCVSQDIIYSQYLCQLWIKSKKVLPPNILIETILKSDDYLHTFKLFTSFLNEWKLSNEDETMHTYPNKKIIEKCIYMLEKLLDNPKCKV